MKIRTDLLKQDIKKVVIFGINATLFLLGLLACWIAFVAVLFYLGIDTNEHVDAAQTGLVIIFFAYIWIIISTSYLKKRYIE